MGAFRHFGTGRSGYSGEKWPENVPQVGDLHAPMRRDELVARARRRPAAALSRNIWQDL